MNPDVPARLQQRLTALYAAFNARDVPTLLAAMTPDVSWANGWEGGTVRGRAGVADYWRRQFQQINPSVVPTEFRSESDGRIAVAVHQVVRDRTGATIADHHVTHLYRFENGLVASMEIRE